MFDQISTIFAFVELKIFETVIAFLNNRISYIAVAQLARKLWGGAKSSFRGLKPD